LERDAYLTARDALVDRLDFQDFEHTKARRLLEGARGR
jgi:hypothetical protein